MDDTCGHQTQLHFSGLRYQATDSAAQQDLGVGSEIHYIEVTQSIGIPTIVEHQK
jgi:hypothetical protein